MAPNSILGPSKKVEDEKGQRNIVYPPLMELKDEILLRAETLFEQEEAALEQVTERMMQQCGVQKKYEGGKT